MGDSIPSNKSLLGKVLRLPLKLIPHEAVVPVLRGPDRGYKWIAGSGPHSCWLGINETGKRRLLNRKLQRGDVFYDIGANVGTYTMMASAVVGPEGRVVAFEPLPDNLKYLHRHVELNNLGNVTVYDLAIWDESGTVRFEGTADRVTSHVSENGGYVVKTVTLDEFVSRQSEKPPDVIKIDVEGAEYNVLNGAVEVIGKFRPAIFLAVHGREQEVACLSFLVDLGYDVRRIKGYSDEWLAMAG